MITWRLMTSCPCPPQRRSALRFPSLTAKRFELNTRSTLPNPSNACSCFPLPSGHNNRHLALLHLMRSLNDFVNIRLINYYNFRWPLILIPLLILIFVLHLSVSAILLPPPLAFYWFYFSHQTLPHLVSRLNKIVPLPCTISCRRFYVYICNIIQTFGSIHWSSLNVSHNLWSPIIFNTLYGFLGFINLTSIDYSRAKPSRVRLSHTHNKLAKCAYVRR